MKKILVSLLLVLPFIINAEECNRVKNEEYSEYSNNIQSDYSFNEGKNTYTITLYNVVDGLYAMFEDKEYNRNSNGEIVIDDVKEGTYMAIYIYGNDGCDIRLRTIFINLQYFNPYYNSVDCAGYEDKIKMCSSQFTSSKVTLELLNTAKENYDNIIVQDKENEQENQQKEKTLVDKLYDFGINYGIKIALVLITCLIFIPFYRNKLIKLQHGI